jgi:amino acid permease
MWSWKKNWVISVLGLWLILLGLLGFPSSVQKILTIITGLIIAFISFRKGINETINEKIS